MLDSTYHVGVNTVGQSLRNANRQLRSGTTKSTGKCKPMDEYYYWP